MKYNLTNLLLLHIFNSFYGSYFYNGMFNIKLKIVIELSCLIQTEREKIKCVI